MVHHHLVLVVMLGEKNIRSLVSHTGLSFVDQAAKFPENGAPRGISKPGGCLVRQTTELINVGSKDHFNDRRKSTSMPGGFAVTALSQGQEPGKWPPSAYDRSVTVGVAQELSARNSGG